MEIAICALNRTAIGKFGGTISKIHPSQMGAVCIKDILKRANLNDVTAIDEIIGGVVVQAGLGQNPARQAAIWAGLPPELNSFTINKVCGSGLKAGMLAAQAIKAGDAEVIIGVGMESMSLVPHYIMNQKFKGFGYGDAKIIDGLIYDGLSCIFNDGVHMGVLGDWTAKEAGLTKDDCDQFALQSQTKAQNALSDGWFDAEIVPIEIQQRKGDPIIFKVDECPRATTMEALQRLKPVFTQDGVITAGNASQLSDGAACGLFASGEAVKRYQLNRIATIVGYQSAHVEPKRLFFAPPKAINRLLERIGWKKDDVDLWELNEAFSSQSVANIRELDIDPNMVNIGGGAIALGHPIGASGMRILVTLVHHLKRLSKKKGIASACLGGGGAVAMAVEIE